MAWERYNAFLLFYLKFSRYKIGTKQQPWGGCSSGSRAGCLVIGEAAGSDPQLPPAVCWIILEPDTDPKLLQMSSLGHQYEFSEPSESNSDNTKNHFLGICNVFSIFAATEL